VRTNASGARKTNGRHGSYEVRDSCDFHLFHDALAMDLDGSHAELVFECEHLVRLASDQLLEDLALARGQHVAPVARLRQRRHKCGVDERLPGGDLLDRAQQRLVRRFLEDVSLRARLDSSGEQAHGAQVVPFERFAAVGAVVHLFCGWGADGLK
jgi:hypothetical protein